MPLIVLIIVALFFTRGYMSDLARDYNDQIIRDLKVNIESFFEEPRRDMSSLKSFITIDGVQETQAIRRFYDSNRLFHHLLIIDEFGSVIYTYPETDDKIGWDYSKEKSFAGLAEGSEEAWSNVYIYSKENKPSINYAVPYEDKVLLGVIHLNSLQELFDEIIDDDELIVGVTDSTGVYIMHTNYENVEQRVTDLRGSEEEATYKRVSDINGDFYMTSRKTNYQDWYIIIYEPVEKLQSSINEFVLYLILLTVVLLIVLGAVGFRFNNVIFKNLDTVVDKTKEVRAGRYSIDYSGSPFEEFDVISKNFTAMTYEIKSREDKILAQNYEIESMNKELENRVVERTNELYSANQELEIALENLKRTQDQLIESEKLASLGDLVAGLAHEINTPLGIILTIITYMQESTKHVKEVYDSGLLKKSDFEQHLTTTLDSEVLIYDNITRAIELISSFKLISAEQRNIEKRNVNVNEFMESIIKSIEPQLKKAHIKVQTTIEQNLTVETIPISLYQVVVNLIMNSKVHAYDSSGGLIDILVNDESDHVEIIVQDYGKGIPKEYIRKIFDPFFTTKRGAGGTGLGLNIVYNTVKQNLQGEIKCLSEENVGTQFIIHIPYKI
jgi:signal transduction histidine kinase